METPPTEGELKEIIQKLNIKPIELIRQKEKIFQEKYAGKTLSNKEYIQAMIEHPILIERPIIINGDIAIIGRPPIKVLDIL